MKMFEQFSNWIFLLDYALGIIMWLLIFGFLLNLFFVDQTKIKLISFYFECINKTIKYSEKIIPFFLPKPLVSIYLAWLFFMTRFYLLPLFNGFDAIGYLSFPLENLIYKHSDLNFLFEKF